MFYLRAGVDGAGAQAGRICDRRADGAVRGDAGGFGGAVRGGVLKRIAFNLIQIGRNPRQASRWTYCVLGA